MHDSLGPVATRSVRSLHMRRSTSSCSVFPAVYLAGGEGATAREVLRHKSVEKVVMVDIDKVCLEQPSGFSTLFAAMLAAPNKHECSEGRSRILAR